LRVVRGFDRARGASELTRDDATGFAPPPAFGPFRVLHQIGVGALGPVFRTYEPTRDRLVAVKVFRLDVTPEQARALADELGRAADASLFHPSIVEPVAAGIEGTVAYRAEEYVAAESLDVAMRHYAPATVDKALPFITQLASAIDFARAAGVGHGALHPRDVFVSPDEARATGFGVVDALDRLGLRAPVRRPYSPPERIAGQPWATPADVFSLAVIAYELLTGRRPSGLGDDMGRMESTTGTTLGDRAGDVRAVLARAMHADPSKRYSTARAFSAALAEASGVAETIVAVAPRIVTSIPAPNDTELPIATPEPAVSLPSDLPLTAASPVDDAARDVVIADAPAVLDASPAETDHALDDFATEPEVPSPTDSPREVARKVIAAREVRKRQVKSKDPSALFDSVDAADARSPALIHSHHRDIEPATSDSAVEAVESLPAPAPDALDAGPATLSDAVDSTHAAAAHPIEPRREPVVEPTTDPVLEAVEVASPAPGLSDRIVAVDEFRARDITGSRLERWPRASERGGFDRAPLERPPMDRPDRPGLIRDSPVESIPADVPPPALDDLGADRTRLPMLPLALMLCLGLVIGYALGQFRAHRENAAPDGASTAAPSSAEAQTSTTGKVPAASTTVNVPPPSGPPAVPPERAKSEASPPPARTPAPAAVARGSSPSKPLATSGRLVVTSNPSKAAVTVNGKWSGRTPLTLTDLRFGKYVVRVVETGFDVARSQFELSPDAASRTVDVTLRPSKAGTTKATPAQSGVPPASKPPAAAATGEIYVDSRPRGARVFVNGKEVGVTPLSLTAQAPGPRDIRLELADHQPWTTTTRVIAGNVARVTGSLDRIR
jgi:serine/threonine-protein kinase